MSSSRPPNVLSEFYIDNDALADLGLPNAPAPGTTMQIEAQVVAGDIWWRTKVRIVRLNLTTEAGE